MDNHFDVFGLPVNFHVNLVLLKGQWRGLQSQFHPDRGVYDDKQSSRINTAYAILENPLTRALHILELNGHAIDEGAMFEELDFLEQQLAYNERIERAVNAKNISDLEDIDEELADSINEQIREYVYDPTTKVQPVRKWLFLRKVRDRADEALFEITRQYNE